MFWLKIRYAEAEKQSFFSFMPKEDNAKRRKKNNTVKIQNATMSKDCHRFDLYAEYLVPSKTIYREHFSEEKKTEREKEDKLKVH